MTKVRLGLLFFLLLVLASRQAGAALSGAEKKSFELASESFQVKQWERAARDFAAFAQEYPNSEKVRQVILFQAQAQYELGNYVAVVDLLRARLSQAEDLADQFMDWIGAAQFAKGDYAAAADSYGQLARNYPASPKRLEAAVNEATAYAKLEDWEKVKALLKQPDGPFRLSAAGTEGNELVSRGFLRLAEAQFATKDFAGAGVSLGKVGVGLAPELDWQRRYLNCQVLAKTGQLEKAVQESAGMIQAAQTMQGPKRWELVADGVVFRGELLEQMGRVEEALAAWQQNFTNAPIARQRQALTRATALALRAEQWPEATRILEAYLQLNQYTNPPADVAWLTLGEIHLKQHASAGVTNAGSAATNHLAAAKDCFQQVLKEFPSSSYTGKAQLGLGWCFWLEQEYAASEGAFAVAVNRLSASEDRVVAQFKLADAQFVLAKPASALTNYQQVLVWATNWPAAEAELAIPASYQALRASLLLTNANGAEQAMREILARDGASSAAVGGLLLVAQAYVDARRPGEAMRLFDEFAQQFPSSDLRPEVELLVARLREEQGEWVQAAATYDAWLGRYETNRLRPQVEFQRALAAAGMGEITNALQRMTNFVGQHPNDELALRAQWWIGDYYFTKEDYAAAELSYKRFFQTWPKSELAYQARMMAGRAAKAMGSSKYGVAIEHFISLTSDTNCPTDLWMEAMLAYGGVEMSSPAPATNKLENYQDALRVFKGAAQRHPTNALAAVAWGEVGNCALQLADYATATDAYNKAFTFPTASVAVRSQAKCGLAAVLEKQAQQASGAEQARLLHEARNQVMDVYQGTFLQDEAADAWWRSKAAYEAARLSEVLQEWSQAIELYREMLRQRLWPASAIEPKIERAEAQRRLKNEQTAAATI